MSNPFSPEPASAPERPLLLSLAATVVALLFAAPSLAHESWLAPSSYGALPGRVVEIGAVTGDGFRGDRVPFSGDRCVRLVVRTARTLDLSAVAVAGTGAWARFASSDGGGAMVAYQSEFLPHEMPADRFEAYLAEEGLDSVLAARKRAGTATPGRERYRRCSKAWLAGASGERALEPIDLPIEIVPLEVPGEAARFPVRVLQDGKPLAGVLLRAWRQPLDKDAPSDPVARDSVGMAWQGRTDARGEALVPVGEAGEWMISGVTMTPSADPVTADWESTWASLTFAIPDRAGR